MKKKEEITLETALVDCYAEDTARKIIKHKDFKAGEDVDLTVINSEFEYHTFVGILSFGLFYKFIDLLGEKLTKLTKCDYKATGACCGIGSPEFEIKAEVIAPIKKEG